MTEDPPTLYVRCQLLGVLCTCALRRARAAQPALLCRLTSRRSHRGWHTMASVVSSLGSKLLDQSLGLPQRFRVLFSLRGVGTPEAADALLAGTCPTLSTWLAGRHLAPRQLTFRTLRSAIDDPSALCRHEVAFALGQMQARRPVPLMRWAH